MPKVLTLFGTRPEVIKLAPVIRALEGQGAKIRTLNVASSQHTSLLHPFVELFQLRVDRDLEVMQHSQSPEEVCARVLTGLKPILHQESPDLVIVQGDTTTALAGGLAGFHSGIPVAHVEAGLRSGDRSSPFPEEMNRRLITQIATYHLAATARNRESLLREGVPHDAIFVTGNPVVDALRVIRERQRPSARLESLLTATEGSKRILVTTHRRESHGLVMARNLLDLREFVAAHADVVLVFPVHPNPAVKEVAEQVLKGRDRIYLEEPMSYGDFIGLAAESWLIVSDSGGVQEEAPSLGKPVLVLRENTERPEAIDAGVAKLVGGRSGRLTELLEEAYREGSWVERVAEAENPFGDGRSGERIAAMVARLLGVSTWDETSVLEGEESTRCHQPG